VPDFGDELHDRGFEGVFSRNADVDLVVAAFVGGVGGSGEVAFEVGEVGDVGGVLRGGDGDSRVGVLVDVGDFLLQAAVAVSGRHGGGGGVEGVGKACQGGVVDVGLERAVELHALGSH